MSRESVGYVDGALRVQIATAPNKVVLQNSELYVEYTYHAENKQTPIRKLLIKRADNEDQVCQPSGCSRYDYLEADAGRGTLASASLVHDRDDRKTVRLTWHRKGLTTQKIVHEVSIYAFGVFLETDYLQARYQTNIVDLGQPGGTGAAVHLVHGHQAWNEDPKGGRGRGYITHRENGFFGAYYDRYEKDGVGDPTDGGALNYHGHFIYGVYNPDSGHGFARTMRVKDISIIKLLHEPTSRRGLETFPYPFARADTPRFTGYLYVFTDGPAELLSVGKQLADGARPRRMPTGDCNKKVQVTASPERGWKFVGWSGALSSSQNPASVVLTGQLALRARFAKTNPGDGPADAGLPNDSGGGDGPGADGPNTDVATADTLRSDSFSNADSASRHDSIADGSVPDEAATPEEHSDARGTRAGLAGGAHPNQKLEGGCSLVQDGARMPWPALLVILLALLVGSRSTPPRAHD